MTNHPVMQKEKREMLDHVREGMTVYDSNRNDIGTVEEIYFGAVGEEEVVDGTEPATATGPQRARRESFVDLLAEAFDPRDRVPDELAERLRHHGYIKIDSGWFGSDRYVLPNQIASVSDEGVYLNTIPSRLVNE